MEHGSKVKSEVFCIFVYLLSVALVVSSQYTTKPHPSVVFFLFPRLQPRGSLDGSEASRRQQQCDKHTSLMPARRRIRRLRYSADIHQIFVWRTIGQLRLDFISRKKLDPFISPFGMQHSVSVCLHAAGCVLVSSGTLFFSLGY